MYPDFRLKETCSKEMYLLPSDHFQVAIGNNFEHFECKFTIHLPVGKRVDLRMWKLKNETSETIKVRFK